MAISNGNGNAIPFIRNDDIFNRLKKSMILWYDIAKQGCTNESMAANPKLTDFSGNNNDGICNNFTWSGMSGIGGYIMSFLDIRETIVTTIDVTYNKIIFKANGEVNKSYNMFNSNTPSFKIKVSGINDNNNNIILKYYYRQANGKENIFGIYEDGEYIIPTSYNVIEGTGTKNGFNLTNKKNIDIVIEQIPLYPNAIVTDGIDDFIQSPIFAIPKFTIFFDITPLEMKEAGITKPADLYVYFDNIQRIYVKSSQLNNLVSENVRIVNTNGRVYDIQSNYIQNIDVGTSNGNKYGIYIGRQNQKDTSNYIKEAIRKVIIFNIELTDREIKYVCNNLINT